MQWRLPEVIRGVDWEHHRYLLTLGVHMCALRVRHGLQGWGLMAFAVEFAGQG